MVAYERQLNCRLTRIWEQTHREESVSEAIANEAESNKAILERVSSSERGRLRNAIHSAQKKEEQRKEDTKAGVQASVKVSLVKPEVKAEPVKIEVKPELKTELKLEPIKPEPAKPEPAKPEPAKTEPAKTEPAKTEPAKTEPPTPTLQTTPPLTTPSPQQLVAAVTSLNALLQDKEALTDKVYHALKEEMWKLQHVINTVSLERRKIVECASNISSLCASYHNEDVALLLKNFVVERLFSKGEESREIPVALSFAYLLCELASQDALCVSLILGQLFSKCPLLIPDVENEKDLPPVLFEKHMRKYAMLVSMFVGLFLYTPKSNANPFDVNLLWKWFDSFMSLYVAKPFVQFSAVVESFLAIGNAILAKKDRPRLQKLLQRLQTDIMPSLESIPSMTSGSIMRLSLQLEDYQKGVFKQPEYCTLDDEWSDCSHKQSTRGARPILSQSGSRPQSSRTSDCCSH